jgi:putative ABC transport system ATP-binding protein
LTRRYDDRVVVDEASLDLRAGELGVLLGRSGSGKSTLLMAITGWLEPDAGTVELAGAPARRPGWHELSYLAQRFALLPELTVADNVTLPERLARRSPTTTQPPLLESLGLAELADRPSAAISVGQQQRTALARALTTQPRAVVADEPTSHQDAASAELVWSALRAACDRGAACLVATNDESAAAYGDRVWAIAEGRVRPL